MNIELHIPTSVSEIVDIVRNKLEYVRPLWKLGLPLGSAFITALTVDNVIRVISIYWLTHDLVCFFSDNQVAKLDDFYDLKAGGVGYSLFLLLLRSFISLVLWPISFFRIESLLIVIWLIVATSLDFLRHGSIIMMLMAWGSFNIFLMGIMPVIRICVAFTMIESAIVLQYLEEPHHGEQIEEPIFYTTDIDPIGSRWKEIKAYYKNRAPGLGFKILLLIDAMSCFVMIPTMKSALGGIGGFFLVFSSVFLDAFGVVIIVRKEIVILKIWRMIAAFVYLIYIILFVHLVVQAFTYSTALNFVHALIFLLQIIYRVYIFFFSLHCSAFQDNIFTPINATQNEYGTPASTNAERNSNLSEYLPSRPISSSTNEDQSGRNSALSRDFGKHLSVPIPPQK